MNDVIFFTPSPASSCANACVGHLVVTPALVAVASLQANKPSPVGEKQSVGLFFYSSLPYQGKGRCGLFLMFPLLIERVRVSR